MNDVKYPFPASDRWFPAIWVPGLSVPFPLLLCCLQCNALQHWVRCWEAGRPALTHLFLQTRFRFALIKLLVPGSLPCPPQCSGCCCWHPKDHSLHAVHKRLLPAHNSTRGSLERTLCWIRALASCGPSVCKGEGKSVVVSFHVDFNMKWSANSSQRAVKASRYCHQVL